MHIWRKTLYIVLVVACLCVPFVATSAHAATAASISASYSRSATVVKPAVSRMTCNGSDYLIIDSDYGNDEDCFAYSGSLSVAIYNVDWIYSGNNTGYVRVEDSAGNLRTVPLSVKDYYFYPGGLFGGFVYKVFLLVIY